MNDKKTQLNFSAGIVAVGLIVAAIIYADGGPIIGSDGTASLVQAQPGHKEFDIVMQNNRYNPSEITVDLGDRVVLNLVNRDNVAHGFGLAEFGASIPQGHLFPNTPVTMEFVANRKTVSDAATCGGPNPTDKTDDHGEEFIVNVI